MKLSRVDAAWSATHRIVIINSLTRRDTLTLLRLSRIPAAPASAVTKPDQWTSGQVAQVVERSPEKAGVGGSTPSLATIFSIACKSRISLLV